MEELLPDSLIGAYRVIRTLGAGGMGTVYEVEHNQLGVHYAMKTFTLQEGHVDLFRRRFSAEGKILARLNHPNLVRVIDLDIDAERGILYFVMDFVAYEDGEAHTLADIDPGGADEEYIFEWFRQMCDVLSYIHAQGIVHRDIKLNNILIRQDRSVVLSDFGIAKIFDEKMRTDVDVTKTMVTGMTGNQHFVMGTPGYIAPEVQNGEEPTPASDVYSLAVAFFRLLTNVWYDPCLAPSRDSDSICSMNSVKLLEPFEYRWAEVLPLMLSENPAERPLDLAELPGRLVPQEAPARPSRRGWVKWLAAVVAILLLAGAGAWWFFARESEVETDDLYDLPSIISKR